MSALREAKRVARRAIVIKDHACDGFLAWPTLRAMDWGARRRAGLFYYIILGCRAGGATDRAGRRPANFQRAKDRPGLAYSTVYSPPARDPIIM